MNKERRKELSDVIELIEKAQTLLEDASDRLDSCKCDEEDYRDNIPENLQGSERYEMADTACDELANALDSVDDALNSIADAIGSIENATE